MTYGAFIDDTLKGFTSVDKRLLGNKNHSAIETQAFYAQMGCQDAEEVIEKHVQAEPYDCQLTYDLTHELE